jgi:type II secretory pathway component PulL
MTAWVLDIGRTHWRLHAGHAVGAQPAIEQAFSEPELVAQVAAIREALTAKDYGGEPVLVSLQSTWCLGATLSVARAQELRDRQTILYRLEDCIPWSVEDSVADYMRAGNKALVVAAPAAPLAEFFQLLEEQGVPIQSIVPSAILACTEHMQSDDWPADHLVALQANGWIDLFCIAGNAMESWSSLPATAEAFGQELKHQAIETGAAAALVCYGLDGAVGAEAQRGDAVKLLETRSLDGKKVDDLTVAAAAKVLAGQLEALLELKRDAFGRIRRNVALRRYAAALHAAMAMLVIAAMGVLLYRGQLASRHADLATAQQSQVFRSTFPNVKVPVGIRSRLESELAKLKGLQGDDRSLPKGVSALALLHRMLAAMPTDRRFRLFEIRIEEGRLYLDGEVIGHSDAEAIAQRLRAEGFTVTSPRTQRLDDKRVSLRITATLAPVAKIAARTSS